MNFLFFLFYISNTYSFHLNKDESLKKITTNHFIIIFNAEKDPLSPSSLKNNKNPTWKDGQTYCEQIYGTNLAKINTISLQNEINKIYKKYPTYYASWIGLKGIGSKYEWLDGTTDNTAKWDTKKDKNLINNENYCVMIYGNNKNGNLWKYNGLVSWSCNVATGNFICDKPRDKNELISKVPDCRMIIMDVNKYGFNVIDNNIDSEYSSNAKNGFIGDDYDDKKVSCSNVWSTGGVCNGKNEERSEIIINLKSEYIIAGTIYESAKNCDNEPMYITQYTIEISDKKSSQYALIGTFSGTNLYNNNQTKNRIINKFNQVYKANKIRILNINKGNSNICGGRFGILGYKCDINKYDINQFCINNGYIKKENILNINKINNNNHKNNNNDKIIKHKNINHVNGFLIFLLLISICCHVLCCVSQNIEKNKKKKGYRKVRNYSSSSSEDETTDDEVDDDNDRI